MTKRTIKSCSVKTLAIFLSVLMIFYLIPATAYASLFEATAEESVVSEATEHSGVIFEDISRREENVKHFRLADGTYMAAQYDTAVHTLDENGEWQDIDNTLSESGDEYSTSNARIKFTKKITGNESIFTLHENNRKITLSLDGAIKKTAGVATNTETEFDETATTLQKMMTLDKLSSRIIYEDILDGVDLEYIVNGNDIKENIIVKEKKDNYVYSFTMKLNNLTAVMMDDGSIIICDESSGEAVYTMPAPVMWDSAYNTSNAASMTLTALDNGSYTITVTADSEWMNSAERTYPVTIDPALSTEWGLTNYTCVDSGNPTQSWSASTLYNINNSISTYVSFNSLPSIPNYAYITSASICMRVSQTSSYFNGYIGAYEVLTDWDTSLTYNDTIAAFLPEGQVSTDSDYLLDYNYILSTSLPAWTFYWDITNKVKDWYSGEDNYGIAFKIVADTTASGTLSFTAAMYPYLTVSYKDMYGLEDYWSFASHSAGLAGDGYVNLATGNLVLNISTLTTTDALLPFTSSLTYNSSLSSKYYTNANRNTAFNNPIAPLGFTCNLYQSLVQRVMYMSDGSYKTYYIYTDSDGTEHSFLPSTNENETNIYYDEDGLQLKLTVSSDNYQKIVDSNDNTYVFANYTNTNGNNLSEGTSLIAIKSVDGHQINLDYNSTGQISNILLKPFSSSYDSIKQMRIYYDSNGFVKYFLNENTQKAVLFYYTGNYLTQVVYAHQNQSTLLANWDSYYSSQTSDTISPDAICYYQYDHINRLNSIRDSLNQREIGYEYDLSDRITKVTEYGGTNPGQSIEIEYYDNYTKVRTSGSDDIYGNSDDIYSIYVFDNEGRCISNYSTDITGYYLYGATSGEYVDDNEKAKNNIKSTLAMGNIPTNYLLNSDFSELDSTLPNYWSCDSGVTMLSPNNSLIAYNYNDNPEDLTYLVEMSATSTTATIISQNVILIPGTYTLSTSLLSLEDSDITVTLSVKQNNLIVHSENVPIRSAEYPHLFAEQSEGSLTFDVSGTGYQSFTVSLEVKLNKETSTDASIYVQHISLSRGEGSNLFNKVSYGSFEESVYGGSTGLVGWNSEWLPTEGSFSLTNECYSWNSYDTALKITSRGVDKSDYASQTIYEATQEEIDDYKASPYSISSKSYQVSARGFSTEALSSPNSVFGIIVEISYVYAVNNGDGYDYINTDRTFYLPFLQDANYIQYALGHIKTEEDYFVKKITLKCDFSNQSKGSSAYFDDVALCYVGTDTSHTETEYNEDGYVSEIHSGYNHTWYIYSGKNVVTEISNNSVMTYTYYTASGAKHRVKSVSKYAFTADPHKDNGGYTSTTSLMRNSLTEYTYNNLGLVTTTVITSGNKSLTTRSTYITDLESCIVGTCNSQTNELGKTTHYFYDDTTGNLLAVVYPDETGVSYQYDSLGRLEQALPATMTYDYVMEDDYYQEVVSFESVTNQERVQYDYDDITGRLSDILTSTTQYNFVYDAFGNSSEIKVLDSENTENYYSLAKYEYYPNNGKLKKLTYGNGDYEYYLYDELDRLSEICYNNSTIASFKYTYDANGNLSKFYDYVSNQVTSYIYNSNGLLRTYYVSNINDSSTPTSIDYAYDSQGRTSGILYKRYGNVGTVPTEISYYTSVDYDTDGLISGYTTNLNDQLFISNYSYNGFGAITSEDHIIIYYGANEEYGYTLNYQYTPGNGDDSTTTQVASVTTTYLDTNTAANSTTSYSYDSVGNITEIAIDGVPKYSYEYDDLGQLTRENNAVSNRTYIYTYDNAGNIESKTIYAYTTGSTESLTPYSTKSYSYTNSAWGDLLMSYGGTSFEYDNAGNPTHGSFGGYTVDLEWENGRQLSSIYAYDEFELSFTYNDEGIRTSKNSNGTVHYYTLAGDMILSEEWVAGTRQYLLLYHYDANGQPIGMSYRRSTDYEDTYQDFLFIKNIQGDVTGIMDEEGNLLVTYAYDAWGNHISTVYSNGGGATGAVFNPFRYRGYYYDYETCLYYLNSRYYDPASGRFISPDSASYIGADGTLIGYNLFAYCGNNPVMRVDPSGKVAWELLLSIACGIIASTFLSAFLGGVSAEIAGDDFIDGFISGAFSGFVSTTTTALALATGVPGGMIIASFGGFAAGVFGNIVQNGMSKGFDKLTSDDWVDALISGGICAVFSAANYGVTYSAMRDSFGLFENIVDKGVPFSKRFVEAISISPASVLVTLMISTPLSFSNNLLDIIIGYPS